MSSHTRTNKSFFVSAINIRLIWRPALRGPLEFNFQMILFYIQWSYKSLENANAIVIAKSFIKSSHLKFWRHFRPSEFMLIYSEGTHHKIIQIWKAPLKRYCVYISLVDHFWKRLSAALYPRILRIAFQQLQQKRTLFGVFPEKSSKSSRGAYETGLVKNKRVCLFTNLTDHPPLGHDMLQTWAKF